MNYRPGFHVVSFVAAALVAALSGVVWLVLFPYQTLFWLFQAFVVLATFGVVRTLLYFFVEKRLESLYRRLPAIVRRPEAELNPDVIARLNRAVLDAAGTIRQEMTQMQEVDLLRKEFIGNVSHELKTPIFAIEGFIETLLDGALEDKKVNKKFLKQALKNVQRLNALVEDLMTLTQLEAGELRMQPEPFSIYELVLDVFEMLEYKRKARGRDIEFVLQAGGLEDALVLADPDRIRQVLDNLVSNAIKYGRPDGRITVELARDGGKLVVHVRDNGYGVDPEHLPRLFERFYRIENSRSREMGGAGLGLAIVKNILEAHHEDLRVYSEPGQGACFSFTLTLA